MKVPSSANRSGGALEIQMTPMIDMVFLLIVFFVWTSGMEAPERLLPSRLAPELKGASTNTTTTDVPPPEADFDPVIVRVSFERGEPKWFMNDEPLASLAAVEQSLTALRSIKADAPVIIHPEPRTPLGHVIDVYDLARRVGFHQIQFTATKR